MHFGYVFGTGVVFGELCVIEIQGVNLTDHKRLHRCIVPLLRYFVGFPGDAELLRLVVVLLHQQENILVTGVQTCALPICCIAPPTGKYPG